MITLKNMNFNYRLFFKLFFKSIFSSRDTDARLTPKRILVLLLIYPYIIFVLLMNKAGFVFDEIFFRGYRKIEVKRPVFIMGVPRSGTTFLHRLLSKDEDQFSYMKTWEIFYAPSIIQKKFFCEEIETNNSNRTIKN